MPERTISLWLMTSASAGASFNVGKKPRENRMNQIFLGVGNFELTFFVLLRKLFYTLNQIFLDIFI